MSSAMMEVCLCSSGVGNEDSLLSIYCLPVLPVDSAQLSSSPQTPTHMNLQDGYLLTGSYGKMEGHWNKIVRRSSSSSVLHFGLSWFPLFGFPSVTSVQVKTEFIWICPVLWRTGGVYEISSDLC